MAWEDWVGVATMVVGGYAGAGGWWGGGGGWGGAMRGAGFGAMIGEASRPAWDPDYVSSSDMYRDAMKTSGLNREIARTELEHRTEAGGVWDQEKGTWEDTQAAWDITADRWTEFNRPAGVVSDADPEGLGGGLARNLAGYSEWASGAEGRETLRDIPLQQWDVAKKDRISELADYEEERKVWRQGLGVKQDFLNKFGDILNGTADVRESPMFTSAFASLRRSKARDIGRIDELYGRSGAGQRARSQLLAAYADQETALVGEVMQSIYGMAAQLQITTGRPGQPGVGSVQGTDPGAVIGPPAPPAAFVAQAPPGVARTGAMSGAPGVSVSTGQEGGLNPGLLFQLAAMGEDPKKTEPKRTVSRVPTSGPREDRPRSWSEGGPTFRVTTPTSNRAYDYR